MASLSELEQFRAGLAAKGVDVNAPNFYQNPEWTAYLNQPSAPAYSPPPAAVTPNPLLPSAAPALSAPAPSPINITSQSAPQTYAPNDPFLLDRARDLQEQISSGTYATPELQSQYQSALNDLIYGTGPTGVTPSFNEGITSLYQNYLGRVPDQEGIDWYKSNYDAGQTFEDIERSIANSQEAAARTADAQSRGASSGNLYYDDSMFAGNELTQGASAGRGLAQQGLANIAGGTGYDPNAALSATNLFQTIDDWSDYNARLGTPEQQPVDNQSFIDYANEIYSRISPTGLLTPTQSTGQTQPGSPTQSTTPGTTPAPRTTTPVPRTTAPVPRTTNPLLPRPNPVAPLTTRPPTRFPADYQYVSPVARQMAAANDQRATQLTQPVGFASDNPLLSRFGTARLGEYSGARETPGNVPGPFRPTVNPLPGIAGSAPRTTGSSGASGSSGLSSTEAAALSAGVPALIGLAGPALEQGIRALPGGGTLLSALGGSEGSLEGLSMGADGQLLRNGVVVPPDPTTFGGRFNAALKPGWINVASAGLAALPDILNGDYAQGIGAGAGTYLGGAAGTAFGAGIGGIAGNFIIPGLGSLVGSFLGRSVGGLFGGGPSVGPNAGQRMEFDPATGRLTPGPSGADNGGDQQLAFVNKFTEGVAQVVNESLAQSGGKYQGSYEEQGWPFAMEVIRGKINIIDHAGNKREFAGNQVEDAFKYAVGVATGYPGLRLPG